MIDVTRMLKKSLFAAIASVISCGSGGAEARDASDGTQPSDGGTDAFQWSCEPAPPPLPSPTLGVVEVVFDTHLPLLSGTTDSGAVEIFVGGEDGEEIIVATTQQLHFVSSAGLLSRSLRLAFPGAENVLIREIVSAESRLAALVDTLGAEVRTRFCLIDPVDGIDPPHCTTLLDAPTTLDWARVVRHQNGFSVYAPVYLGNGEYAVYRWRFDEKGTLVDAGEQWRDPETSRFLLGAASGSGGDTVITTTNTTCEVYSHFLGSEGRTVTSVRPPTLTFAGEHNRLWDWSGDTSDVLLELRHMNCAGLGPCVASSEWPMSVLFRHDLQTGSATATPIAIPFTAKAAVMPDGDDTAIVYFGPGFYDIRFSRVARNGEALVSEVRLPLSHEQTGIEVQFVGAGRTIAPGDYVFVYSGTGAFRDRRVARIRVP